MSSSDDPARVARDFCARYGLGEEAIPQVTQYLTPLADPVARLAKQEHEKLKRRTALRQIPCWKAEGYITYFKLTLEPLREKLKEISQAFNDDSKVI